MRGAAAIGRIAAGAALIAFGLGSAAVAHPSRQRYDCLYADCDIPWAWDDNETPPLDVPPYPQGFVLTVQVPAAGRGAARRTLNRYPDIAEAIGRCWDPSAAVGDRHWGAITLRLSFKRDGSVNGQPRITYVDKLVDKAIDADLRRSLLSALSACAPLPFSPSLGQAVAGQIFSIRFVQKGRPI